MTTITQPTTNPTGSAVEPISTAALSSTDRAARIIQRVLYFGALILMVFHLAVFVHYAVNLTAFPFDYDEGEGYEINNALLFSQGRQPFLNNDVYPFYGTNYPPFFHILLVPFVAAFGPAYWYGRIIVTLATMLTAFVIGYAVWRKTRHRSIALLAGLAFLASNIIYHIGPLFRQHMVMVMFETLAIVAVANIDQINDPAKRRRRMWLVIGLLLAAGFTKQMAFVTVLAVFGWLFLRGVKRAIAWGVVLAGITAALFAVLLFMSNGYFWTNVITANIYQWMLGQFTGLFTQFVGLHGALLILALLYLAYEIYLGRLSVYSLWLICGAINGVLAGKWGAGDSYWAEVIGAMCIMAGIFTARTLSATWRLPNWLRINQLTMRVAGALCLVLFIVYGLAVMKMPTDVAVFREVAALMPDRCRTKFPNFIDCAGWTMGYATIGQVPTATDTANGYRIVELVKGGSLLSEEAAFNFMTGTEVLTNPPHLLGLWQGGHYNPSELVGRLERLEFDSVIIRAPYDYQIGQPLASLWPPPITQAVERNYAVAAMLPMNGFQYLVLKPAPNGQI